MKFERRPPWGLQGDLKGTLGVETLLARSDSTTFTAQHQRATDTGETPTIEAQAHGTFVGTGLLAITTTVFT